MFGHRLQEALNYAGRDRKWLASKLGTSESAITLVINGQSKAMSAVNAARSAHHLRVNCLWLATGEGEMISREGNQWSEVARKLATAMDAAERGQRYAVFVQEVDKMVERADLVIKADAAAAQH